MPCAACLDCATVEINYFEMCYCKAIAGNIYQSKCISRYPALSDNILNSCFSELVVVFFDIHMCLFKAYIKLDNDILSLTIVGPSQSMESPY